MHACMPCHGTYAIIGFVPSTLSWPYIFKLQLWGGRDMSAHTRRGLIFKGQWGLKGVLRGRRWRRYRHWQRGEADARPVSVFLGYQEQALQILCCGPLALVSACLAAPDLHCLSCTQQ